MKDDFTQQLNLDPAGAVSHAVVEELRKVARAQLRRVGRAGTLETTALINEAWLKLGVDQGPWNDRRHFFATMSRVMRQVIIDQARRRQAVRRGGGLARHTLDELEGGQLLLDEASELVAIDDALRRLGELDPRLERVVELRFFGGLSINEVAEVLGVSEPTVKRDARTARAFLAAELDQVHGADP